MFLWAGVNKTKSLNKSILCKGGKIKSEQSLCPTLFLLVIRKHNSVSRTVMSDTVRDIQQAKTCSNKYHYIQAG